MGTGTVRPGRGGVTGCRCGGNHLWVHRIPGRVGASAIGGHVCGLCVMGVLRLWGKEAGKKAGVCAVPPQERRLWSRPRG